MNRARILAVRGDKHPELEQFLNLPLQDCHLLRWQSSYARKHRWTCSFNIVLGFVSVRSGIIRQSKQAWVRVQKLFNGGGNRQGFESLIVRDWFNVRVKILLSTNHRVRVLRFFSFSHPQLWWRCANMVLRYQQLSHNAKESPSL